MDTLTVTCADADLDLYVIEGENPYDIVRQFRGIIGRSYIPPKFAFGFAREMKEKNVRLIPIIDAGVKIEEGYDVYEEGVKNGYFCKRVDGSDFMGAVWPGPAHFPDFLNKDARRWFGGKYRTLTDQGIEGFWGRAGGSQKSRSGISR